MVVTLGKLEIEWVGWEGSRGCEPACDPLVVLFSAETAS